MAQVDRAALVGEWAHSHEEDSAGVRVYRRATFPFPRSRGRESFVLRADGSAVSRAPGPVDRPVERSGTWELDAENRLIVRTADGAERVLGVVSVAGDRLVATK